MGAEHDPYRYVHNNPLTNTDPFGLDDVRYEGDDAYYQDEGWFGWDYEDGKHHIGKKQGDKIVFDPWYNLPPTDVAVVEACGSADNFPLFIACIQEHHAQNNPGGGAVNDLVDDLIGKLLGQSKKLPGKARKISEWLETLYKLRKLKGNAKSVTEIEHECRPFVNDPNLENCTFCCIKIFDSVPCTEGGPYICYALCANMFPS